jgi:intracellular septation protein A
VYFHDEGPISGPLAPRLTDSDYRSLNFPYPLSESRVVVWVLAQQHLYFGAFVLGALWWVLLAEAASLGTRDAQRAQRYRTAGHEILRILVLGITIAAALGALLVIALFGLYPGLTRYFAGVFRTTVLFAGVLFVAFAATAALYYYTWPKDDSTRATWDHFGLGVFVNVLGTGIMLVANSWGTFMMSPAGVDQFGRFLGSDWHVFHNALSVPLAVHRFAGNLVFAGAVIAAYAAYRALASSTYDRRAYYDWMGGIALVATIGAFIPLPFIGYWLHREIYAFRQGMGILLLSGLFAWLSTILVLLVGVLIITMTYYVWQRIALEPGGWRFGYQTKYVLMVLAIGLLVYVTPSTLMMRKAEFDAIGGQRHPVIGRYGLEAAKQAALNLMIGAMIWSLLTWWRSKYEETRSWLSTALVALFVVGFLNLLWMSIIGTFIPANIRVGLQVPASVTTLSLLLIGASMTRVLIARSTRAPTSGWGGLAPRGYWALLFIGVTVTWIMGLAGHERSSVRLDWHAMEIVRDTSPWAFTHAAGFVGDVITFNTLFFWLVLLGLAVVASRAGQSASP